MKTKNMIKSTNDTARKGESRVERLLPDGTPRWIRIYDGGAELLDRYTVVFTGKRGGYYVGMSTRPNHHQGFYQHGEGIVDRPAYSHLGKRIHFSELPIECQKAIRAEYCDTWKITIPRDMQIYMDIREYCQKNTPEVYWDYRDELSQENIEKLASNPDSIWEVEDELREYNQEYIWELEEEFTKDIIENFYGELLELYQDEIDPNKYQDGLESWNEDESFDPSLINLLRVLIMEDYDINEYVFVNFSIQTLIERAQVHFNVELDADEFELYDCNYITYDMIAPLLKLLQINPREFANNLGVANIKEFPNYPRRDNPLIDINRFCNEFYNFTGSWAIPVFSVNLNLSYYLKNYEYFQKGITIPATTPFWILDGYYAGTCSLGEAYLRESLRLKPDQFNITIDGANGWGLNDICGLTGTSWQCRKVSI